MPLKRELENCQSIKFLKSNTYYGGLVSALSRRKFIQLSSSSIGILIGSTLIKPTTLLASKNKTFEPSAWLNIQEDGSVNIIFVKAEMGQGSKSTYASIIADELGADLSKVKILSPPLDKSKFNSTLYPGFGSNTGGSSTIRSLYRHLRNAGAAAREVLQTAAAQKWKIKANQCTTANHFVIGPNQEKIAFEALIEDAKKIPIPRKASWKADSELKYIAQKMPHFECEQMARGELRYGMDQNMPGMKYAAISRAPQMYSQILWVDDSESLKIPGVEKVIQLQPLKDVAKFMYMGGVAVIASNTWAALEGVKALKIKWSQNPNYNHNSHLHKIALLKTANSKNATSKVILGDVDSTYNTDPINLEASYYTPYAAHAPLSPCAVLAHYKNKKLSIWAPTQGPDSALAPLKKILGIPEEAVTIYKTNIGGGFGGRIFVDTIVEAAWLSKLTKSPIKLTYSRENDMENTFLHPASVQTLKGSVNSKGQLNSFEQCSAFVPIMKSFNSESEIAGYELDGLLPPFECPNIHIKTVTMPDNHMKQGYLRAVWANFHFFGRYSFIDELARKAKKDPKDFLLASIGSDRNIEYDVKDQAFQALKKEGKSSLTNPIQSKRLKKVIKTVAKEANWGRFKWFNQGQGIAAGYLPIFEAYSAAVVDIKIKNKTLSVEKVHVAIDCGTAINPDRVRAQLEGSVIFGLSLALMGEITVDKGRIQQNNFDGYPVLLHSQSPEIYTYIVNSGEKIGGAGEPGTPIIAPALANAIYDASKLRIRELPINKHFKI